MKKIIQEKEMKILRSIPLPKKTNTYFPISHFEIIKKINRQAPIHWVLNDYNIRLSKNGKKIFGTIDYCVAGHNNLISIGFRNSYDKSISVGLCAGSRIIVCSNLMFTGEIIRFRKHTLNLSRDIDTIVKEVMEYGEQNARLLKKDMILFQSKKIDNKEAAKIIGEAFFNNNIFNSYQVSVIKKEWISGDYSKDNGLNEFCKERTLYSLYQACTHALKSSSINNMLNNYTELHKYFVGLN
tara:strand:+ start:5428 stop:6147 length:720 start_codon:yes stop_codon:yes gene_type:complete